MPRFAEDYQYEEDTVKSINLQPDWLSVGMSNGFHIGWDREEYPSAPIPKEGDSIRLYGKGFGYQVRGIVVGQTTVYYRTEEQQQQKHEKEAEESKQKRLREFDLNKDKQDQRLLALPVEFQERISAFLEKNPTFRSDYEPYELFCSEQAVAIAKELGSERKAYTEFLALDVKKQLEKVPKLSDLHSGNTLGYAIRLALTYASRPEDLRKEHGALCNLVGCISYSCQYGKVD